MPDWLLSLVEFCRPFTKVLVNLQSIERTVLTMSKAIEALAAQVAATVTTDGSAAAKIAGLQQQVAAAQADAAAARATATADEAQLADLTTQLKTAQEALAAVGK